MAQLSHPFIHLKNVLSPADIKVLKTMYAEHAPASGLPCYAFLRQQDHPLAQTISSLVHEATSCTPLYLNDFFFYTSNVFSTPWHVDTELFIFKSAVNVWILLEPSVIQNPLGFIADLNNDSDQGFYHSVEQEGTDLVFVDYVNSRILERPFDEVEQQHIPTPEIGVGDILLIDPMRFHRTNTTCPKGACVFKYVYSDGPSLTRELHIPDVMWPEVGLYKQFVHGSTDWPSFLELVVQEVHSKGSASPLISGFYPDNFPHLVEMASGLA